MNAKSKWLTEKDGNIVIPKTLDSQTFDSDGNSLAERLRGIDDTEVIQLPKVDPTLIVSDLNYSTEEQLTGKRWIDGKPIYQKTLCGTSTSGLFQIDLSSLNIDKFLNPSLNWMKNENGNKDVIGDSYYGSSSDFFRYYFSEDSILKIESGSGYSHGDFYLTIQYTKTTDTADSPVNMPVVDKLPFKFGIDENGNYGYIKVGADTVTPFKSGSNGLAYRIIQPFYESYVEVRLVN